MIFIECLQALTWENLGMCTSFIFNRTTKMQLNEEMRNFILNKQFDVYNDEYDDTLDDGETFRGKADMESSSDDDEYLNIREKNRIKWSQAISYDKETIDKSSDKKDIPKNHDSKKQKKSEFKKEKDGSKEQSRVTIVKKAKNSSEKPIKEQNESKIVIERPKETDSQMNVKADVFVPRSIKIERPNKNNQQATEQTSQTESENVRDKSGRGRGKGRGRGRRKRNGKG